MFFGPFIGELGWELLYWHAWVRKLCRTTFRDYHKVVASYPGREPFYPDADEFWGHPEDVLDALTSPRGYITDFWRDGMPRGNAWRTERRFPFLNRVERVSVDEQPRVTDVEPVVQELLASYRTILPDGTQFFVPFNEPDESFNDVRVGVDRDFRSQRPAFEAQLFERLQPTQRGLKVLRELVAEDDRLICIFPRHRRIRRPDKNWARNQYQGLIDRLQRRNPAHRFVIVGAPGEAYFDDGVPEDCIDLINVPSNARLDTQVAALHQSSLALGSQSGAILLALAAGSPALTWGWPVEGPRYHNQNILRTGFVFHPYMRATVADIEVIANAMIREGEPKTDCQEQWSSERFLAGSSTRWRIRNWRTRALTVIQRVAARLRWAASRVYGRRRDLDLRA